LLNVVPLVFNGVDGWCFWLVCQYVAYRVNNPMSSLMFYCPVLGDLTLCFGSAIDRLCRWSAVDWSSNVVCFVGS
jgi:hypothetical protein